MSLDNVNLSEEFGKFLNFMFVKYRGYTIEKLPNKTFKAFNKEYSSLEEAKKAIDKAYINLNNSIK